MEDISLPTLPSCEVGCAANRPNKSSYAALPYRAELLNGPDSPWFEAKSTRTLLAGQATDDKRISYRALISNCSANEDFYLGWPNAASSSSRSSTE